MATVTVQLPGLIRDLLQVEATLRVKADTVGGALHAAIEQHPTLRVHVFDETGGLRQHVLCLHNGAVARDPADLEAPIRDGDTITVMQAVSGG